MPELNCPTCQRRVPYEAVTEVPYRPFCGKRCQQVDLGRWLNEEYRISDELPVTDENSAEPSSDPPHENP